MRFGVHNCVGARLAKGRQRLQGLNFAEVSEAPIYYYSPPRRDEYFSIHLDDPRRTIELNDYVEDSNTLTTALYSSLVYQTTLGRRL